jgi:hypothetical protein
MESINTLARLNRSGKASLGEGRCTLRGHLQVELQTDDPASNGIGLVRARAAFQEVHCTEGEIVRVAMPVKDFLAFIKDPGKIRVSASRLAHGKPADLLDPIRKYTGTQGPGDELGAETDPEDDLSGLDGP